ncbi:MAG TPA: hypothetical protein VM598_06150 [Bdellovibrionota bacterium]|nr:hypothetical protein [Bdellovibrionota bacterium]
MSARFGSFRQVEGLGISGLLAEDCKVLYANLFSQRHVGRISDLFAGSLRADGLDELRLRALLLFSCFEAWRTRAGEKPELQEPLTVECGFDEARAGVAVTFRLETGMFDPVGLADRLLSSRAGTAFESFLLDLRSKSECLVVRLHRASSVVEVVSLIGRASAADARVPAVEIIVADIQGTKAPVAPKPAEYVEIGDMDYAEILKIEGPTGQQLPPSPLGERMVKAFVEAEEERRIQADARKTEQERRIKGSLEEDETETRVAGEKPQKELERSVGPDASADQDDYGSGHQGADGEPVRHSGKEDITRVQGSAGGSKLDDVVRVHGVTDHDSAETTRVAGNAVNAARTAREGHYGAGARASEESAVVAPGEGPELEEAEPGSVGTQEFEPADGAEASDAPLVMEKKKAKAGKGIAGFLSKVLPFGKAPAEVPEVEDLDDDEIPEAQLRDGEIDETEAIEEELSVTTEEKKPVEAQAESSGTEKLLTELQVEVGGIDRTLAKAAEQASELKRQTQNDRAKRWVDGLMGELLAEKSRLHDLAKQLHMSVRQKENDFRMRERALQEEIRKREEAIKQRTHQLGRTKDQLTQANMMIERFKSGNLASSDDAHFKQKHAHMQRLLAAAKEEASKHKAEIDDLRAELTSLRLSAKKPTGAAELKQLQDKVDRISRLNDDLKHQNQQLITKIAKKEREKDTQRPAAIGQAEEMKKKLEISSRQVAAAQRDAEQFKLRFEEGQKEETRLKAEILRLQRQMANPGVAIGTPAMPQKKPGAAKPAGTKPAAARPVGSKPGGSKPPQAA